MLGQPASSQTVCSPSRRTSDFSSVYSGPVFSRVLIHSGLRSIGTWLLRTSRRSSLRPAGSSGDPVVGVGRTGSLMISTVPADHTAPVATRRRGRVRDAGAVRSGLARGRPGGRPLVAAASGGERLGRVGAVHRRVVGPVAVGELGVPDAHVRLRRCGVAGGVGGGDGLAGVARGAG